MSDSSDDKIQEILGQLAGSASMCWEPIPTGIFDSKSAAKWVTEATQAIKQLILEARKDQIMLDELVYSAALDVDESTIIAVRNGLLTELEKGDR